MDISNLFENVLVVPMQGDKPLSLKCGGSVDIQWMFRDITVDMIEDFKGSCGCTKVLIPQTADRVVATYNDTHKDLKEPVNVSKSVTVYLKDDKPLKVLNDKGVMDYNPEKTSLSLIFHVSVVP